MTVGRWCATAITSLVPLRYTDNSMAETGRRVNALLRRNLSEYRSQEEKPFKTCQQQVGLVGAMFKLCSGQGEAGYGREGALGYERYIAIEHMDVRRDCFRFARWLVRT